MKSFNGMASKISVNALRNGEVKHIGDEVFDISPSIIPLQLAEDNSCFANAGKISVFSVCSIRLIINYMLFHFCCVTVISDSLLPFSNRHVSVAFQISDKKLLMFKEKSKNNLVGIPRVNNYISKRNELLFLRVATCHNAIPKAFSLMQMVIMEGCSFHFFSGFMRAAIIKNKCRVLDMGFYKSKSFISS